MGICRSEPASKRASTVVPVIEELAAESSYRRGLVVPYVEDRVRLRILQHVVDLLGRVQQLQLAALAANRSKGSYQGAEARTVNVVDIA